MKHWTEIKTAASVVETGSVSASADLLNMHRTTVVRHIDTIEHELSGKLFQRHARGFSPTLLGRHLLRIASASEHQFNELKLLSTSENQAVTGEFRITTVDVYVPMLVERLHGFSSAFPDATIDIAASDSFMQLQYGEADIAFRIGDSPVSQDNVKVDFEVLEYGIYGHKSMLRDIDFADVSMVNRLPFVGPTPNTPRASFVSWIDGKSKELNIVMTSDSIQTMFELVSIGGGIGFLPTALAERNSNLLCLHQPIKDWDESVWLISHVDVYRTYRIEMLVSFLKANRAQK